MNRSRSSLAFAVARRLIPGGVNSPARAFGGVGGEPIFFDRAEGAYLYDLDGNRYIDYIGSWGPMILGHRHPTVVEAVKRQADRAFSFGAPTEAESELAQLIVDAIPSVEKVRLVSSGTEATMSAIRLARGFTGREVIVKFAGNYHGHADSLLVAAGSSAATLGVPNSPGVTAGTSQDTLVLPYNDHQALVTAFERHGSRIAGVIFEPIVGNMGTILPTEPFIAALQLLAGQHGTLLICDEVMTGFRVAYGGAQSVVNIRPDLTTLGKIVGGGLPLAAYGGRAEVMDQILPAGKVFQAGTLSGNPLATAAGIATLKLLSDGQVYRQLEALSTMLAGGLTAAAEAAGVSHRLARAGSMMTLFFNSETPIDWQTASASDMARYARYFWGMADRGIYLPCSQFEALFVSAAHTEADIHKTIEAAHDVLREI
jgi:glutamate-1-semialdehyde 2,1-aminomutase